jgi:hypothetical protein
MQQPYDTSGRSFDLGEAVKLPEFRNATELEQHLPKLIKQLFMKLIAANVSANSRLGCRESQMCADLCPIDSPSATLCRKELRFDWITE